MIRPRDLLIYLCLNLPVEFSIMYGFLNWLNSLTYVLVKKGSVFICSRSYSVCLKEENETGQTLGIKLISSETSYLALFWFCFISRLFG